MIRRFVVCAVALAASMTPLSGSHGNFIPDWTFKGATLDAWKPLGQADWRAENGEIVGTPRSAEGGWLLLNQSFQDVQLAASVRCTASCASMLLGEKRSWNPSETLPVAVLPVSVLWSAPYSTFSTVTVMVDSLVMNCCL